MKFALLVAFLGLQTVLAISPFEAIVEEWEVSLHSNLDSLYHLFLFPDLEDEARKNLREELWRCGKWAE